MIYCLFILQALYSRATVFSRQWAGKSFQNFLFDFWTGAIFEDRAWHGRCCCCPRRRRCWRCWIMTDKKKSSAVADMIEGSRPRRHSISGPETAPLVIRAKKEETERGRSSPLRPKELKRTETESRIPRSPRASSSSLSSYNALIRNAAAGTKKKYFCSSSKPLFFFFLIVRLFVLVKYFS